MRGLGRLNNDDREVVLARLRVLDALLRGQYVDTHFHVRMRGEEAGEDRRQPVAADRHGGADNDAALEPVRHAVEVPRQFAGPSQHVLCPRVDRSAGLGEVQLPSFPVEEARPHPALEGPDMRRHHRLSNPHVIGRGGDPPEGHHQFEYLQLVQRNSGVNGHG